MFFYKRFIRILYYFIYFIIYLFINFQYPYHLGDPDNFKIANLINILTCIKSEWYFFFAYSILYAIPNKFSEIIDLVISFLILHIYIYITLYNIKL